ncbi:MAG: hypothetical protein IPI97_04510 [Nitrosomonas sp.]|jgi:hypothetical protein|nr:hypothetical protein [Nitrosomonas sp.]
MDEASTSVFGVMREVESIITLILKETLVNSVSEMKHQAHGTQQPRHIDKIDEGASTAQRSDSLIQSINQRFLNKILSVEDRLVD